jgi:hypothetical protein
MAVALALLSKTMPKVWRMPDMVLTIRNSANISRLSRRFFQLEAMRDMLGSSRRALKAASAGTAWLSLAPAGTAWLSLAPALLTFKDKGKFLVAVFGLIFLYYHAKT